MKSVINPLEIRLIKNYKSLLKEMLTSINDLKSVFLEIKMLRGSFDINLFYDLVDIIKFTYNNEKLVNLAEYVFALNVIHDQLYILRQSSFCIKYELSQVVNKKLTGYINTHKDLIYYIAF